MLRARLLTEFAGTFMFFSVIALSGRAGALAPLVIGLALMAMIYMGGHVSGAHYNPAVSFGLFLRGVLEARAMFAYWAAQVGAGVLAFAFAGVLSGHTPGIHPGHGVAWYASLSAEIVFTAALVLVVMNVAATKETAGNSFYGLAIGMTVAAGAFTVGPTSGGAFNPAVGIAATLASAVADHGSWGDAWLYIVGPFAGAAIGALIHIVQTRPRLPIPPERSEQTAP